LLLTGVDGNRDDVMRDHDPGSSFMTSSLSNIQTR